MHRDRFYTLSASCPDQVGIIARVSGFIAGNGGWILESSFHADALTGRYFMRIEIKADSLPFLLAEFRERFRTEVAEPLQMDWRINDSAVKRRVVVLVSQQEHCLYDLLARWQAKELDIEIPCVISNHDALKGFVEWHGIPFHHVPVNKDNKAQAEAKQFEIIQNEEAELVVLARYMQILSDDLCRKLAGRAINIHHSFLPSFKGAKPYYQAHDRGVKLIGATAHYVTADLDEGPIIEQDVARVDHSKTVEDLTAMGRDTESQVLARAVKWHSEHRILVNGHKTVIFK
jgi:formyltetrahydrofolate deformylase